MVKAELARHNHRDTPAPESRVSGGHACTHSSLRVARPVAGQALLLVCSPPASPVGALSALHLLSAQRGMGLLRRPPHMTCGELFRV